MSRPRPIHLVAGLAVFVVVAVGFVVTMRSCARAIWPEQFAAHDSLRHRLAAFHNEVHR